LRRKFGKHHNLTVNLISDEELLNLAKQRPKLGRGRLYDELQAAGYAVTTERVRKAVGRRDANGPRLKGGRPRSHKPV
jgi:hypothetical protein